MLPYLTARAPWFAFLVHPRDVSDLLSAGAGSVLRQYSNSEGEFVARTCSLPPLVVGEIHFGFSAVCGEVVAAMCLPKKIMGRGGQLSVVQAAQLAVQRGAKVIGLGALASPATAGGASLLSLLPPDVTLTNGNAYTAAVVRRNVLEASLAIGGRRSNRVAVVGCTGSVGGATCQLLDADGMDLLLIGRNMERVKSRLGSIIRGAAFSDDITAIREASILVLLTNDASAKVSPDLVSEGTIIIDVCQPPNISVHTYHAFQRRGIEVAQGGIVQIPGYTCTCCLTMPAPGTTFACLAETYLFAREGIRTHSIGRPNAELAVDVEQVAQKYGVTPRPLGFSGSSCITRGIDDLGTLTQPSWAN